MLNNPASEVFNSCTLRFFNTSGSFGRGRGKWIRPETLTPAHSEMALESAPGAEFWCKLVAGGGARSISGGPEADLGRGHISPSYGISSLQAIICRAHVIRPCCMYRSCTYISRFVAVAEYFRALLVPLAFVDDNTDKRTTSKTDTRSHKCLLLA